MAISVTHFSDPGCPWAYSVSPALAVLRWRYGSQLEWRLVTIGLTEHAEQYVARGYTPQRSARGYLTFRRRWGMPFATEPRRRVIGTSRACRTIVATRLLAPQREHEVFRALQFAWFTTPLLLDEDPDIAIALERVPGLDVRGVLESLDSEAVTVAYEADRALARTAGGSPTEFQGKAAQTDGPVRYTAPSLIFRTPEAQLEAGGFQPVEVYDAVIANIDPTLVRRPVPEGPLPALEAFPEGLVSAEVAAIMTRGNDAPDVDEAEAALIELVAQGDAVRTGLGHSALWQPAGAAAAVLARAA
jgi:predicted DsbA family dithiol-disulfide isomerase